MSILQLKPHIFSIGVQNPSLRVFDIIMRTDYGTTYNAYLVKGEKTALIETVHGNFFDEYLENLKNTIPLEQIDYLILNHTEPDHSGSVGKLLKVCPNLKVLATAPAQKYLSAIVNAPFSAVTVKNGEQLDLGGVTLQFVVSPMLHWPDSMFTWCPEEKTLFTCDFLGRIIASQGCWIDLSHIRKNTNRPLRAIMTRFSAPSSRLFWRGLIRLRRSART